MTRLGFACLWLFSYLFIGAMRLVDSFLVDLPALINNGLSEKTVIILIIGSFFFFFILALLKMLRDERIKRKKIAILLAIGKEGEATILSLESAGKINDDPHVKMRLEVRIPGYSPYQVEKKVVIPSIRISQVQVDSVIKVLADPNDSHNPDKVCLLLK